MRLFLHGRSTSSLLLQKIEQAKHQPIESILLSNWRSSENDDADNDDNEDSVTQALCDYLSPTTCPHLDEITLQNCHAPAPELIAALLQASPQTLTIRFDKQISSLPSSISSGLLLHHESVSRSTAIRHLRFVGVTWTRAWMQVLRHTLPRMNNLQSLSFQGKFPLLELNRSHVSILGRLDWEDVTDAVVDEMIELLQELPQLRSLALEDCHIPDDYLAELLEACPPDLRELRLPGNAGQSETTDALYDRLIRPDCTLESLDLSWQRHIGSKRHYSTYADLPELATAVAYNTSLTTLRLSDNKLLEEQVELLAIALRRNATLQNLQLKNCRIALVGLQALAASLPAFRLKRLGLNGHQRLPRDDEKDSREVWKDLFFEPMLDNVYLHDLMLPLQQESKSLQWLLEWNRAGRRILLEDDDDRRRVPSSLWPIILERADRIGRQSSKRESDRHGASAIYHLLREKGFQAIPASSSCCPSPAKTVATTPASSKTTMSTKSNSPPPSSISKSRNLYPRHRRDNSLASAATTVDMTVVAEEERLLEEVNVSKMILHPPPSTPTTTTWSWLGEFLPTR